jgi:hypothetical protein
MNLIKKCIPLAVLLLPWSLRRLFYIHFFKYEIATTSHIGYSYIDVVNLRLGPNSRIGHLNVIKGLHLLDVDTMSSIGNLNWITGMPLTNDVNFINNLDRLPALIVKEHASITNRHLIDCTHTVSIGKFSTFAGFRSQILTHSIDIYLNTQNSKPVSIGNYSFVGTASVLLPGCSLPSYSVLAAGSVLSKKMTEELALYGGVPARKIKILSIDSKYFQRSVGRVQ